MGYVNLSRMPDPAKTRVSTIQNLKGGLNIHDTPWQIDADQSPEMRNMWWENGALRSRPGMTAYNNGLILDPANTEGRLYTDIRAYGYLYHGWYVLCNPSRGTFTALSGDRRHWRDLKGAAGEAFPVEHTDGMFFTHNGVLFYKSVGGYYRITVSEQYDADAERYLLLAEQVEGFVPTTYMNAVPSQLSGEQQVFGGGDFYQPYNRLSLRRKILYNCTAETTHVVVPEAVDQTAGSVVVEYLDAQGAWNALDIPSVGYFADRAVLDFSGGSLGEALTNAGTAGISNNVRVTYGVPATGENLVQYNSIMECNLVEVYGGSAGLFVVMAGYSGQPNAYFWSGNTDAAMDPSFFPAEHYNLTGDFSDPITGFGKQQNMLVIFQSRQIGRCSYSTSEIDGRTFITLDYKVISPRLGCDLPNTIQLVENNLVFCNKKYGAMFIKDTSSAYENNVVSISQNVETPITEKKDGILYDLNSTPPRQVLSYDDSERYWIFAGSHAWLWDYSLGGEVNNPRSLSWFYFDSMAASSCWFALEEELPLCIGQDGYLRSFDTTIQDTMDEGTGLWLTKGEDFDKVLTLPTQSFGTYEVVKNVNKCIFVVQGSGNNNIHVEYETDYETRVDPTSIYIPGWSLVPRNLKYRSFLVFRFATTAVRHPRCLHIRHFLVRLRNNKRGEGIAFVSAQIFYTLQGVDR